MSTAENRTTNDLLVQLVDGQAQLLKEFSEHKGEANARIKALETTNNRQWWLHAGQAFITALIGAGRLFYKGHP